MWMYHRIFAIHSFLWIGSNIFMKKRGDVRVIQAFFCACGSIALPWLIDFSSVHSVCPDAGAFLSSYNHGNGALFGKWGLI